MNGVDEVAVKLVRTTAKPTQEEMSLFHKHVRLWEPLAKDTPFWESAGCCRD